MCKLQPICVIFVLVSSGLCVLIAGTEPTPASEAGVEGVIILSPVHGGPTRQGIPDSRPLANTELVAEKEGSAVTSFKTDEKGAFRILLPPGHYTISAKDQTRTGRFEVDVIPGEMKKVHWDWDTGIR